MGAREKGREQRVRTELVVSGAGLSGFTEEPEPPPRRPAPRRSAPETPPRRPEPPPRRAAAPETSKAPAGLEEDARRLRKALAATRRLPKAHAFDRKPRVRAKLLPELKAALREFYERYRRTETRPGLSQAECARVLDIDKGQFNTLVNEKTRSSPTVSTKTKAWKPSPTKKAKAPRGRAKSTVLEVVVPRGEDRVVIVLPNGRKYTGPFLDAVKRAGQALRSAKPR